MPDRDQLVAMIRELRVLATQAKQRGDARVVEPTPGYCYVRLRRLPFTR